MARFFFIGSKYACLVPAILESNVFGGAGSDFSNHLSGLNFIYIPLNLRVADSCFLRKAF